jgi:hypothetical protein
VTLSGLLDSYSVRVCVVDGRIEGEGQSLSGGQSDKRGVVCQQPTLCHWQYERPVLSMCKLTNDLLLK